jgi:hypothetical protein
MKVGKARLSSAGRSNASRQRQACKENPSVRTLDGIGGKAASPSAPESLQGFALVQPRNSSEWKKRYLILTNGLLKMYSKECSASDPTIYGEEARLSLKRARLKIYPKQQNITGASYIVRLNHSKSTHRCRI